MIYDISYISLIDKVDEFIRGFDGTRYLVLFVSEKYNYNRIRNLTSQKNSINYLISHNYATLKIDSYDSSRKNMDFA